VSEDGRKEGRMPASKQASLSVNIVLLPLGRIFDPRNVLNRFINYCVTIGSCNRKDFGHTQRGEKKSDPSEAKVLDYYHYHYHYHHHHYYYS